MHGDDEERPRGRVEPSSVVLVNNLDEIFGPEVIAAQEREERCTEALTASAVVVPHHQDFATCLQEVYAALQAGKCALLPYGYPEENAWGVEEFVQNRHQDQIVETLFDEACYRSEVVADGLLVTAAHCGVLAGVSVTPKEGWFGPASASDGER